MSGLVRVGGNWWSRLGSIAPGLVPEPWLRWLGGPATTIVVSGSRAEIVSQCSWPRPVHVLLEPDLMLQKRLTLPAAARGDLSSAVDLMVMSATPFAASELLIHVSQLDRHETTAEIAYLVRFTPKDRVLEALRSLDIPAWRVTRIAPVGASAPSAPNFADALTASGHARRAVTALSIAAVFAALIGIGQMHLSRLRSDNAVLEQALSQREDTLRNYAGELSRHEEMAEGRLAMTNAFVASPSVFLTLEELRATLPADVSVGRVALDGAILHLDVRAPQMLQFVRVIAGAMPHWSASVEGPIARSPDGAMELATLRLEWLAP